ncbi:MAG: hypothetical protein JO154_01905 [Chitinophaga sp.]|uniref:hypothetical protein n=1 Tax=Chitinophaga sp. TaxID=1869181 RepID=UPI0025C0ED6C|nr:hypothetical protein [Chitinophaga sp.]MBV8251334.1 hypothetical protein [Chitinophaga sp.]
MTPTNNPYIAILEKLQPKAAPDDLSLWSTVLDDASKLFSDPIPVSLLTTEKQLSPEIIHSAAQVLGQTDDYLTKAIHYIKDNFKAYPEKYKIKAEEIPYLSLDTADFPLEFPEFTFYDEEGYWLIHFAEGKFENCDPHGIVVIFTDNAPTDIELLDDCEPLDE